VGAAASWDGGGALIAKLGCRASISPSAQSVEYRSKGRKQLSAPDADQTRLRIK
jgi:hypothetical protein